MRAAMRGVKNRSKLLRTSVSCRIRSAKRLFSIATATIPENATTKSRSSSVNRCALVRLSTYSTPATRFSVPIERRADGRAHLLMHDRLAAEAHVLRRIVRQNRDLLLDRLARDRERHRPAEVRPAAIARDAGDEILVLVEQQNRESIDLENLEHHLGDLLEQRRDVGGARERLRDLEQQRELLPNALLVRQDDRGLVHHELRPARPQRLGECLVARPVPPAA